MISPARARGRKSRFCSSVATLRIVWQTIIDNPMPSVGAPAIRSSSRRAVISKGSRSWPPYSAGHEAPIQPCSPMERWKSLSCMVPVSCARSMTSASRFSSRNFAHLRTEGVALGAQAEVHQRDLGRTEECVSQVGGSSPRITQGSGHAWARR